MPFSQWLDKEAVAYITQRLLLYLKRWNNLFYNDIDGINVYYAKLNKSWRQRLDRLSHVWRTNNQK